MFIAPILYPNVKPIYICVRFKIVPIQVDRRVLAIPSNGHADTSCSPVLLCPQSRFKTLELGTSHLRENLDFVTDQLTQNLSEERIKETKAPVLMDF